MSSEANFRASESPVIFEAANPILSLEKKLSRSDGLDKEMLNLKDVICNNQKSMPQEER